jgi:conjugative relaxase-like TrwC/TraI family protein
MLTIRAMSDGKGYSSKHLEHNDYYAEGERVVGYWQGRGAELLGLNNEVKFEDFEALRQGMNPATGEFLRQRQSADRINQDGAVQSRGRHLYDFTISAPKSVSIMAIPGNDRRLMDAHRKAVNETLRELESYAATRIRQQGANNDRITGNMAIAVYNHDTSRDLDPQLHTHAVAANLTYDGTENRWKALQASGIYERRAYLTEVYRNILAREVHQLGYEIENCRDSRGRDTGFEIRGIPRELLAKYSQRSKQRDEAINRFITEKGRKPSDNEIAVLVRESRSDKLVEISTPELRRRQRARLAAEETQLLSEIRYKRLSAAPVLVSAESSLLYAQDHVFERVSVALDHHILSEALRHGRGQIDHEELKGEFLHQEISGKILRCGKEIATKASLQREYEMIQCINRGIGGLEKFGGNDWFLPSHRLTTEQVRAVEFILNSRDQFVNIRGAAGTGKTAVLQELHRGLREARHDVIAIAPTASAVDELKKVGFSEAVTLERLLQDRQTQEAIHKKVIILDEAGMVSGRQMLELLHIAERNSARIVFSGDTKQIQSVEACNALQVLEKAFQCLRAIRNSCENPFQFQRRDCRLRN